GPPDDEVVLGCSDRTALRVTQPRCIDETLIESEAVADHRDLVVSRDVKVQEVVTHLGADGDDAIGGEGEGALDDAKHPFAPAVEVAAQHMAVEGVDYSFRPRTAGHECRDPARSPRLRGVRVQDIRS